RDRHARRVRAERHIEMVLARQATRTGGMLQRGAHHAAQRVLHQMIVPDQVVGHGRPSLASLEFTLTGSFRPVNWCSTEREIIELSSRRQAKSDPFGADTSVLCKIEDTSLVTSQQARAAGERSRVWLVTRC